MEESPDADLLSAVTARNEVVVEGHPVGHVEGFAFVPDPITEGPERRMVLRAARRALRAWMPGRVAAIESAPDAALGWTADHQLTWDGVPVARLRPGRSVLHPVVEPFDSEYLDGPARERLRLRLDGYVRGRVRAELAPLFAAEAAAAAEPALRGPVHRLLEAAGLVAGATEAEIPAPLRGRLKALGVRAGRFALFLPAVLKPRAAAMRAALWSLTQNHAVPALPAPSLVSCSPPDGWPPGFARAMGWVEAGPVLVRLDIAERLMAELAFATRHAAAPLPPGLASRLSIAAADLPAVLRALGVRLSPGAVLSPGTYGPPAPPVVLPARRPRPAAPPRPAPPPRPDNPFAALLALRT